MRSTTVSPASSASRRAGMGMVEVLLGILILSFGIIPIYHVFTASRKTVVRSELSYVAMQAARDRLEELRLLPMGALEAMAQRGDQVQFEPMQGGAFDRVGQAWAAAYQSAGSAPSGNGAGVAGPEYQYPPSYRRILTRMVLTRVRSTPPFLYKATCFVRWEEKGPNDPERANEEQQIVEGTRRRFSGRFETLIGVGGTSEGGIR